MHKFEFVSDFYTTSSNAMDERTQDEIKNEPMLFSCDLDTSWKLGGPITKEFILKLPKYITDRKDFILDTRVHMLMEGWYPAIPGYHLDDVPRELPNGQPNHFSPSYKAEHAMCLINGEICPTHFALGVSELPDVKEDEKYYKVWHPLIEKQIEEGKLKKYVCQSNQIIFFDWQTFHTGTKAVGNGFRFFARASWNTNRIPTNELRRQVQVYLEFPMEGW